MKWFLTPFAPAMTQVAFITLLTLIAADTANWSIQRTVGNVTQRDDELDRAMTVLFDESILAENSVAVTTKALALEPGRRYDALMRWVLPSETHESIRLAASFVPSNESHARGRTNGNLVSPALTLVATAKELGRLDSLREQINTFSTSEEVQQRSQLALLTLVGIAEVDFDSALASMSSLSERHRKQAFAGLSDRWPETLVAAEAIHHPQLQETANEILQRMLIDQVRTGINCGPNSWDRLILSLVGQLEFNRIAADSRREFGQPPDLRDWFPVSNVDAGTNGTGLPRAHWERDGHTVRLLSHHNDDYLYFQSPLTGNYQVECIAGGFDYRDAQLLVAGTWIGPVYTHEECYKGHVGRQLLNSRIQPRLSEIDEWIRILAVVQDRQLTFSVNGREVHSESLPEHHDPWLAIRIPFHTLGSVRDLRITGQPIVPESLKLSENRELQGWTSYFGGTLCQPDASDWWHELDDEGNGIIEGQFQPMYQGTAKENLLRYQRSMIEDGVIEYDFFYEPGRSHVHPALGRQVLLLNPEGIKIHRITNAHFDQTGADPIHAVSPGDSKYATSKPRLVNGKWNHLRLQLRGNVLDLEVNGQPVFRDESAEVADRTFGLFHYSSETEARVRNVTWRGDWPKSVPTPKNQELRDTTVDTLDKHRPTLTAEFNHDFTTAGLPLSLFQVQDQGVEQYVSAQADGLHIDAEMTGAGYRRVCVTPLFVVEGDFDMTADFEGLEIAPTQHGRCDALLQISLTDEPISHHGTAISTIADPGSRPRRVEEHQLLQLKPFHMDFLNKRSEEVTSGTMRLVRQGDKMYSLLAAGDSKQFRLIRTEPCVTHPSRFDGARIVTGMNSSVDGISRVSIVWRNLTIRAQRLVGPAIDAAASGKP